MADQPKSEPHPVRAIAVRIVPKKTMAVVVEYLIVEKADSFCDRAEAFTALLNVDSSIDIDGGPSVPT